MTLTWHEVESVNWLPVSQWPELNNRAAEIHVNVAIDVYDARGYRVRRAGGDPTNAPGTLVPGDQEDCIKLTKTLDGPYRTSDDLFLADGIVPVAAGTSTSPYYFRVWITVENCGTTPLSSITVTDTFSNEAEPLSASGPGIIAIGPPVDPGSGFDQETLIWTPGPLPAGNSATLTIKVGGEASSAGKIAPTAGDRQDVFFNGQDDNTGSARATALGALGPLSVSVGAIALDFRRIRCAGSDGEWEHLPGHDDNRCAEVVTRLPITLVDIDTNP